MRTSRFRQPFSTWGGVARSASTGLVVVLAASALVVHGQSGQGVLAGQAPPPGRTGKPDFDPAKKGAWRFLEDNLGELLERGEAAYRKGDYRAAATSYLTYLYRNGRDSRVLYVLARCYSRMGNAEAATEVLAHAAKAGFVFPELLESDEELRPIRETPAFKEYQKKAASLRDRLGQTILVVGPRANRCRVRLPSAPGAGKPSPLVIGLHGNGGNADDMMDAMAAESFPGMICAAPEGAYPRDDLAWMPGGHFSWRLPNADRALWPVIDPPTSDYILAVVEEVSRVQPVSEVILLGFSQGVSVAYLAAMRRPERLSAVIAFAGSLPADSITPQALKAGNRLRVLIAHGADDAQVPVQQSERARDLLRDAGYRVQFETFAGGHELPRDMMRRAGEWIRGWAPGRDARKDAR